jgi:hypothetical protein
MNNTNMQIKIATIITTVVINVPRGDVRTARAIARSWLKQGLVYMWGGQDAYVYVKTSKGCWHKVGIVGNQTSHNVEDEFAFMRKYQWR